MAALCNSASGYTAPALLRSLQVGSLLLFFIFPVSPSVEHSPHRIHLILSRAQLSTMAELLGIVSGGAGLLSLSLQLLDSSQKLKGFYHNVKNAPKMLDTLSFDLQTMSLMVRQFERYRQESEDDPLLQRCIFRLQEDVKSINDLVKGLEARLTRSRILGKLSSAFNEPEILRSLNMLERAKSSMLLAHQMYAEYVSEPKIGFQVLCLPYYVDVSAGARMRSSSEPFWRKSTVSHYKLRMRKWHKYKALFLCNNF